MAKTLNARIITKHDTAENWSKAEGFVPKLGEIIIVDTAKDNIYSQYKVDAIPRIRIGDGKTKCKDLPYITDAYVAKEQGKKLSSNDYSNLHYNIVDEIANLGYPPVYTDTKYNAGYGLGIKNNSFYSTGVIDINNGIKNGTFKCAIGKGPNGEYEEKEITILGLTETAFTPISNFLTSSSITDINKAVTTIEPSTEPGVINYINVVGETTPVAIPGLGKLAFKDGFDGDFVEVVEVAVQSREPVGKIPVWINNETSIVKFYDIISNTYKDILTGVTDLTFSSGGEPGCFSVSINGEEPQSVKIYGLTNNAFSSAEYLSLAGGTVTGITKFSNTTEATSTTTGAVRITGGLGVGGNIYGKAVYGAVYNDYAEYRQSEESIEPGYIVYSGDDGILHKTVGRLQFFEGVVSDTFGFSIGKTDKAQTPLAVAGRVLVYTDEELHAGNVVCAGPHGKACKMTKQEIKDHPDRIVGIVSEVPSYETWGEENIPVNGRVWIRVK